ncbi:MAG TPA: hypothetical protein V6C97_30560 [Oculatellaceae cyanobacterium]
MASQEMLKKLLEEFDEKEAQAREEINIINVRIEELEKRIGASQDRLGKIAADRLKISQMMERYVNGSFLRAGGVAPSSFPSSSTSPIVGTPAPVGGPTGASVPTPPPAPPASPTPSISAPLSSSNTIPPGILNAPIVSASTPVSAVSPAIVEPTPAAPPSTTNGVPITPVTSSSALTSIANPSNAPLSPLASVAPPEPPPVPPAAPAPGPALSPMAGNEPPAAPPEFAQLPPAEATIPIGSSQPLSPMASLSSASLFSSPPAYSTDTGDNPAFQSDAASQAASSSPFMSPPSPPPIPPGGLSSALKQSMPTGGTQPASQENRSKFDMMDLFAPLANDEEPKQAEAAEFAEVAEASEPEPSPWAAPEAPPAPEPESAPPPAPAPAPVFNSFFSNAMPSTTPPQSVSPAPTASLFSTPPASAVAPATETGDVAGDAASTSEHPSLDLGEDPETEDGDDTVKSINDALRGLFR